MPAFGVTLSVHFVAPLDGLHVGQVAVLLDQLVGGAVNVELGVHGPLVPIPFAPYRAAMDEREQNLAEAAKRAAKHLPKRQARGAGVSAYEAFAVAFEAGLAEAGYKIERVGGPATPPSAGD